MINEQLLRKIQTVFPKSSKYGIELIKEKSIGGSVLFSLENLVKSMDLKPGMRVLDLGCGKALSSIFLFKEFDVDVWAVDNFFPSTENYELIKLLKSEKNVFPLNLDARKLPFSEHFFDFIIIVNSYYYFGTDDKYLPYICKFLKYNGKIGIADICFTEEINDVNSIPEIIKNDFFDYWYFIHSINWWKSKWEKTGLLSNTIVTKASQLEHSVIKDVYLYLTKDNPNEAFAKALHLDEHKIISFFSLIGTRSEKKSFIQNLF